MRRGRAKFEDQALEERRATALEERRRQEEARKRRVSIPSLQAHDSRDPFMRCLIAFYGEAKVASGPAVNPEELPARLGRAKEFWREWESWKEIGAAPKRASEAKATAAFSRYF